MVSNIVKPSIHFACRSNNVDKLKLYSSINPNEISVVRPFVPDDKVNWNVDYPQYSPSYYVAPIVLTNPNWSDNENNM
jgi:hypothetical protein